MKPSSLILMAVTVGAMIALTAFYLKRIRNRKLKIRDALFQMGFGYRKHDEAGKPIAQQEIKFKNLKDKLVFIQFNYGLSTLDFYKKQQALEELFCTEFVNFKREGQFEVVATKAKFDSKILKTIQERTEILIGSDGSQRLFCGEAKSAFIFSPSGAGKTYLLQNCFINQFVKMSADIHIITSKKSDFENAFSYHNNADLSAFKAILEKTESNRLHWEEIGYRNKIPIVFVFDEVQEANDDKQITTVIKNWVRVGRSQNIWVLLASQSGTVTSLRNIEINLVPIKIAVRYTESVSFAETIFTPELAFKSHHMKQPQGFGYVKTSTNPGTKVRFYYEPQ